MDKYEAIKGCIIDYKQYLEEIITVAEQTKHLGYEDVIYTTKSKLSVVNYFIKKMEEFDNND